MSLLVRELSRAVLDGEHERVLLAPISLTVNPGQVVGVIGPSGSGKSTLLRVLAGLDPGSGGEVLLEGRPVAMDESGAGRSEILLLPQEAPAFPGTPRETLERIGSWRRNASPGAGLDPTGAVAALGLPPDQIDRPWSEASGGERRRLWLALAATLDRRWLLLDEPTTGLDADSSRRVAGLVRDLAKKGRGVLVATHDEMLLARVADHVVVLFDGEMHAEGPPEAVIPQAVAEIAREKPS